MIKAALFDLDGTLVDTLEDLANSCNLALTKYGFPTHDLEAYKIFIGNGMKDLIDKILPEDSRDEETHRKVFEAFFEHYSKHFADKSRAYDGLYEVVCDLKNKGYKVAVVSNKIQVMTDEVVKKCYGDLFDIVCGNREGYPPKPDPTLTLKIIAELGVKPEECVFIGDSGNDAKTAVNVGCIGIGVLWGFRGRDELSEGGDKYFAETPRELFSIIEGF